ncbi:class I SAM-dependent methyltransferase [Salipaludibacillus sp. CUR1]|uniref:class I SAM-dependent methyltransferase n=1 Tax=Salipaludibacillus sp. CUR1 TaxID=2820003 RepID=UPI001E340062|nr:class I SAM-dependent methyltransferase [Salipaludibacillus sp. CUR1]
MADHYYSKKPAVESNQKEIREEIRGQSFRFYVDRGVFSKSGLDYGTRLLLETFREPDISGPIGDIGCGWGPIGISIAKSFPERPIHMVDINERSVQLSEKNARLNQAGNIKIDQNNLLDGCEKDTFAALITNPPVRAGKETVFALYEQARDVLKENGELWVVLQKKQGAPSTQKKLEELNFDVTVENKSKGYFIFKAKKH